MTQINLNARIRKLRQSLGWTQKELYIRTNISVTLICKIEKGERNINFSHIERFAKALGIEERDLVYASDNEIREKYNIEI